MHVLPRHYWRRHLRRARPERFAAVPCDASGAIASLSRRPQPALSWFGRFIAFLTTPFKFLGVSGWEETGCDASGRGRPTRDAQHSTDGFWTIDIELESLAIGQKPADFSTPRYLRLEVEPETVAHDVCAANEIGPATDIAFGGAVVIDTDGPFLEVHPEQDFRILGPVSSHSGRGTGSLRSPF